MRKSFIARNDDFEVERRADYSQIELRIMYFLSKDESMLKRFNLGIDIHSLNVGAKVYKVEKKMSQERCVLAKNGKFWNYLRDFTL